MTNTTAVLDASTLESVRTSATSFLLADGGKGWIGARTGEYAGKSSSLQTFTGDIPESAYRDGLFGYDVVSVPMAFPHMTEDGITFLSSQDGRTVQYRTDTGRDLGTGKDGKAIHSPLSWAVDLFASADAGLRPVVMGSTGYGARSFIQFTGGALLTSTGVDILPTLTFCTSVDSSLRSGYFEGGSLLVCNNQTTGFSMKGIAKNIGATIKVSVAHSKHSDAKRGDILPRLSAWEAASARLTAEIDALAKITVTDSQISAFLDLYAPTAGKEKGGLTRAENKRDAWSDLYYSDKRCSDWTGTALGVAQTCNTFDQHIAEIRGTDNGADRLTRQIDNYLTGKTTESDAKYMEMLSKVLV